MSEERINLLPQEYTEVEKKSGLVRKIGFFSAGVLLILAVLVVGLFLYRENVGQDWMQFREQVEGQREFINRKENQQLEGKMRIIQGKAEFLKDFFEERELYGSFVETLTEKIPTGMKLTSIDQTEGMEGFEIRGQAGDVDSLNSFTEELRKWDESKTVTLKTCDYRVLEGEVVFTLNLIRSN